MLSELIASGGYAAHVARMRPLYARKAATLQRALVDYAEPYATFRAPRGGFFLWVELRDGLTAEAVQRAAFEEGVVFPVGHAFFPGPTATTVAASTSASPTPRRALTRSRSAARASPARASARRRTRGAPPDSLSHPGAHA